MSDMTMRERIARALAQQWGAEWDEIGNKSNWLADADAVLAEMREPTPGMVNAGGAVRNGTGTLGTVAARAAWQAMIDAAMEGK